MTAADKVRARIAELDKLLADYDSGDTSRMLDTGGPVYYYPNDEYAEARKELRQALAWIEEEQNRIVKELKDRGIEATEKYTESNEESPTAYRTARLFGAVVAYNTAADIVKGENVLRVVKGEGSNK
jgi:hypothetical protein